MKDIFGNKIYCKDSSNKSIRQLLLEFIDNNSLSKTHVAQILSMNKNSFLDYCNGKTKEIKINHLIKIMNLLNIREEHLIDLCLNDFEDEEISNIKRSQKISYIIRNFDLDGLKNQGFLVNTNDYTYIEERICNFFGLNNIYEYSSLGSIIPLFSKSRLTIEESRKKKMLDFGLKCAKLSFESLNNTYSYDKELLVEFMKRIKTFSIDVENGFATVVGVLFKLGVTVIVQDYITRTAVYGLTMVVNNKPCIVVSNQGKRYHILWTTLMHELYHLINDYDYIQKVQYHVSDEKSSDLFVDERAADKFASDSIVGEQKMEIVARSINYPFKVQMISEKLQIHTSLLYGLYLKQLSSKDQKLEYPKYSKYLISSTKAVNKILYNPVKFISIKEALEDVKKEFKKIS